jgi:hypothetical protein
MMPTILYESTYKQTDYVAIVTFFEINSHLHEFFTFFLYLQIEHFSGSLKKLKELMGIDS